MSSTAATAKILLQEDDPNLLDVLKSLFRSLGHRVKTAATADGIVQALKTDTPDILVCDYPNWTRMNDGIQPPRPLPPAIITASYGELEQARQAVGNGAEAILTRPVRTQVAIDAINAILPKLHQKASDKPTAQLEAVPATLPVVHRHLGGMIGETPVMQALYDTVQKAAATDMTVLIRGESGTGKDLLAHAVHEASSRKDRPFIALNCSAVPPNLLESELFGHVKGAFTGAVKSKDGLFKTADGGTIFLDEIGSIPVSMQLSLLRVLQDRTIRPVGSTLSFPVDVRVVAATNENLEVRIKEGLFREDLFFRLNSFPLTLPPLRERQDDIPLLAAFFLAHGASGKPDDCQKGNDAVPPRSLTEDALEALRAYPWPGNIRELQNIIARSVALNGGEKRILDAADLALPAQVTPQPTATETTAQSAHQEDFLSLKAYLKICERDYIRKAYLACNEDKEAAAKLLGISIGTFYRKYEE